MVSQSLPTVAARALLHSLHLSSDLDSGVCTECVAGIIVAIVVAVAKTWPQEDDLPTLVCVDGFNAFVDAH